MTRDQITKYIAKYARHASDAPAKYAYYCNFPSPTATRVFSSGDPHDLAEQIFQYCRTPGSRKVSARAVALLEVTE